MLSSNAIPYIDASVPVLREHGTAITRHFYDSMFGAHPELRQLFNMGNQANGSQQQALAAAVFAYAANHRDGGALAPVIERIVHKHVSVGIRADHYPIVGHHLLDAIQSVLGEAATAPLLAAWDEAYWALAERLIDAEKRLYARAGVRPGELRSLVVTRIRDESEWVRSFYLEAPTGGSPGSFEPGQYISVAVDSGELRQLRQYSLSDAPERPWWRISVKREHARNNIPGGQVSNWLHENVKPGDRLEVGPACGDFTPSLDGEGPIALVSAGVGITPMISILNTLAVRNPDRQVLFAHAAQCGRHHALRDDVQAARNTMRALRRLSFYESPEAEDRPAEDYSHAGLMDPAMLAARIGTDAEFHLCGPLGFMQAQWRGLVAAGVAPSRIHREVFGPELLDHLL